MTSGRKCETRGVTTGEEAARPDVLAREIAKCDAALGGGSSRVTTGKP